MRWRLWIGGRATYTGVSPERRQFIRHKNWVDVDIHKTQGMAEC